MDTAEFDRRKRIGTTAEIALRDLLTAYGGVVTCHQHNHDAAAGYAGAAIAHAAGGTLHLPDLSVLWPQRGTMRAYGIEVKTKSPLANGGGWGWDVKAFHRALAWSLASGDPVVYAIRDRRYPMPPAGVLDDPLLWHVATCWKLLQSPLRSTAGQHHYWPADEFVPLLVLLAGEGISAATVPYIALDGGRPPLLL